MIINDGTIHIDKYKGHSFAPGYRDITLKMEINDGNKKREIKLRLSKEDCLSLFRDIVEVQRLAWSDDNDPIDKDLEEKRPNFSII